MAENNIQQAVLFGLIAAFLNASTAALVKLLGGDVPTSLTLFARFATGLAALVLWRLAMTDRGLIQSLRTDYLGLHVLRSVLGLCAIGCLFFALVHIPMVDAILLNVSHPLFVPFIVALFLGIPFAHRLWPGILMGFVGVIFVLKPGYEVFQWQSLVGLMSGALAGSTMVVTRRLNHYEDRFKTMFYYFFFSTLVLLTLLPFTWKPVTQQQMMVLFLVGLVSLAYQMAFVSALRHAPARIVTPLFYMSIVFGGFFDWLGWGIIPTVHVWIGSLMVFAGATLTILAGRQIVRSPVRQTAGSST